MPPPWHAMLPGRLRPVNGQPLPEREPEITVAGSIRHHKNQVTGHQQEGRGREQRHDDADEVGVRHAHIHGFEQGALGARAGAVDLVGQQHLAEHRAGMEDEAGVVAFINADADQVAGHEVGGELHPRMRQPERERQGVGQGGLAHAGQILDQQVATGQQAGQAGRDLARLAHHHAADLGRRLAQAACQRRHVMNARHAPNITESLRRPGRATPPDGQAQAIGRDNNRGRPLLPIPPEPHNNQRHRAETSRPARPPACAAQQRHGSAP